MSLIDQIRLGFTGTRRPLTYQQTEALGVLVHTLKPYIADVHHGDCVSADAAFHKLCNELGLAIRVYPPSNPKHRAFCMPDRGTILPEKDYLLRNADIVNASTLMIAMPGLHMEEQRGSGTWQTIRLCRNVHKPVIIIWPTGAITGPAGKP